nr:unnamed protein product [Callosobruchus chinensis]
MLSCLRCNAIFERQITLDEHILRTHPNFIAFVISKIHECTLCAFKTTRSGCFKEHLLEHPEANPNYKFRTCAHCNVAFKKKVSLDNHMLNKHPNFISSVTYKIHKCTECNYRTTMSTHLKRHLLKHTETPTNHILRTCAICPAEFKSKRSLDDHILRNHPNSIASVTYKIHECTLCTFKTTRKTSLDNHVIKKHPNSTSSVTNKIHRCTECNYKTTKSTDLKKHSLKHTEILDTRLLSTCAFCPAGFKSKRSLDQHIVKKHPNCIASVTKKILKCTKCTYKTTISSQLKSHLVNKHPTFIAFVTSQFHECGKCTFKTAIANDLNKHLLKHPEKNYKYNTCTHCDVTFKRKTFLDNHLIKKHLNFISSVTNKIHKCTKCSYKTTRQITLNEHILRTHPNFIAFITSKIHECTLCAFKTTRSDCFKDHLLKHPEANTNYKFRTCAHCNVAFKKKVSLDNHMLNKHPNFISSVTHKIHKCTECNYRTTMSNHLKRHLLKHTETPTNHKLWTCTLCSAGFNSKRSLDDHILRNHPHSIAFVTYKIHECTLCTFKTTRSDWFQKHLLKHPGTISNYKFFTCRHCNTTFKTKTLLDNHVIKKHPNSTSSVTNKIHRCTECNYKTTKSTDLKKHSLKHTEIPDTRLLSTCAFCPAGFKSKRSLDQHIVKKHPNSIASVTEKILKCRKCTYKTTISSHLKSHLLNHSKAPA